MGGKCGCFEIAGTSGALSPPGNKRAMRRNELMQHAGYCQRAGAAVPALTDNGGWQGKACFLLVCLSQCTFHSYQEISF